MMQDDNDDGGMTDDGCYYDRVITKTARAAQTILRTHDRIDG